MQQRGQFVKRIRVDASIIYIIIEAMALDFAEIFPLISPLPTRLNKLISKALGEVDIDQYDLHRESTYPYFGNSIRGLSLFELQALANILQEHIEKLNNTYTKLRDGI